MLPKAHIAADNIIWVLGKHLVWIELQKNFFAQSDEIDANPHQREPRSENAGFLYRR